MQSYGKFSGGWRELEDLRKRIAIPCGIKGQDKELISKLKKDLSKSFDMKDLGPTQQILGMKIVRERTKRKLWLSQEKYIERVLERFNMKSAKPVSTPLAMGSLMYAMVCTRPDIAHAIGVVSRFLENPGKEHREAVKWILGYLRGGAVSWQSKLQKCVTLSTIEAEYIAATKAGKEMVWLKRFLQKLGLHQK
uniref:Reverse transcriptase Ty1/copia-type domain-containing protein n=1 Tax=Solanum lycopersicum TaxID=4081 RepID=A0A3Q7GWB6_SOLLC